MRALLEAAGIRVADEGAVEERIQFAIQRMMQEPVAHACLVDVARLRVAYLEVVISAMRIGACRKLAMQAEDVVHQAMLELLHVFLVALPMDKFFPSGEQILDGDDIFVGMSENNPRVTPPPNEL